LILLKIQKSRKETQTVQLGLDQNLAETQALIREAYSSIHWILRLAFEFASPLQQPFQGVDGILNGRGIFLIHLRFTSFLIKLIRFRFYY